MVEQARIETTEGADGVRERDLRNARDNEGIEQGDEGEESATSAAVQDYQLLRALDLLKGIATYTVRATN